MQQLKTLKKALSKGGSNPPPLAKVLAEPLVCPSKEDNVVKSIKTPVIFIRNSVFSHKLGFSYLI